MRNLRFMLLALLVITGVVLTGCGEKTPDEEGDVPSGGKLSIIVPQTVASYSNIKTELSPGFSHYVFPAVETLVGMTKDGPAPTKLATGWEVAPDGKSITFTLRKGVKFHDGTDFNAEAVKWNLDMIRDKRAELAVIESIDVLDEHTVRLNLSEYSNTLLYHLTWYSGLMISPTAGDEGEAVGTGPFVLKEFSREVNAVFTRFDDYWDEGKPYLDELEFVAVADFTTAHNAFLAGEAHAWDVVPPIHLRSLLDQGYQLNTVPSLVRIFYPDSSNPDSPFAEQKVRYALEHAIDKEALVERFGMGIWDVPLGPCAPGVHLGASAAEANARRYDPEKAKQLLAEAGYPDGFEMTIYSVRTIDDDVLVALQGYLLAVGIKAEIVKPDSATMSSLRTGGWKNGVLLQGLTADTSSYVGALEQDGPSLVKASSVYISPEYSALMKEVAAARDPDTERELSEQLVRLAQEEGHIIPLYVESRPCVYDPSVYVDINVISIHFWNPGEARFVK